MASRMGKLFGRNRTEIVGDKEVRANLKRLGADVRRAIVVPAMIKAMAPMYVEAQQEIDVSSGRTLGHLVEKTTGAKKGRTLIDVLIRNVPYGGFHEIGTRFRPGDHDMLRAFDGTKEAAVATALRLIGRGIERRAKG